MLEMRRPSVFGQNFPLKTDFFLFHDFQDSLISLLIHPVAVSVLTEIHFKVVGPVLESFH